MDKREKYKSYTLKSMISRRKRNIHGWEYDIQKAKEEIVQLEKDLESLVKLDQ